MVSVRASVEPLNNALGGPSTIFLTSFAALPLINQALAAENPVGDRGFIVTLRALIKVLGEVPIAAVVQAVQVIKEASAPHPPPPSQPPHGVPTPTPTPQPTCQAELYPTSGDITQMRIFGVGFVGGESVDIIELGLVAVTVNADTSGGYFAIISELAGVHSVHARGQTSGRISRDANFVV